MALGISDKNDYTLTNLGYKIVSEMKVTGVTFTYEKDIFRNKNFTIPLINIKGCKPTEDLFASEFHLRTFSFYSSPTHILVWGSRKCYFLVCGGLKGQFFGFGVCRKCNFLYRG